MFVVMFDGVCNLCNNSVQFIIRNDKEAKFKFASLQSDFAQKELKERNMKTNDFDTIVLLDTEKNIVYTKSTAILRILKDLKFPFSFLYLFIIFPKFIRDWSYSLVANNRYKIFGKQDSCMLPSKELLSRFMK